MAAYQFLSEYRFVKIDKRNPVLMLKPELREAMVLRRMVHKMFDMLICDQFLGFKFDSISLRRFFYKQMCFVF